ncbi:Sesquipedalian-1 [Fasciola hepatica]|uniref:Sesquipedalian-1 n=1 Tax=Fasciola hepatica TaxID=6192 RepID=A0A4E0R7D0_FASHE|nr:Sesquipedalian-1 [Fasciola hepatica]
MRICNPKTIVQFLGCKKEERAGYLWKRKSETKGSYKRRYFVAYGNILAYYEKKVDKEPLGVLFLENHVIEMVDDLTMVIRFLAMKELPKGYYLRGDSTEDIEQWMRVLSRSGIDFFTLTLEDLEDQLHAVSVVNRASSNSGLPSSAEKCWLSDLCASQVGQPLRRPNPFNSYSIFPPSASTVGDTHPSFSDLSSVLVKRSCECSSADMHPTRSDKPDKNSGVPSIPTNVQWLLSQDWQQLHAKVRMQLSEAEVRLSPNSPRQTRNS